MRETRSHNALANKLAKKFGTEYNKGPGVDIQTPSMAIEVEPEKTIGDAGRQLQGYRKPVYVAPTTKGGVEKALERYGNTSIGVMNNEGNIIKRSKRK